MGYPKALLPVPPLGLPLIQQIIQKLRPLASRVVVVANDKRVIAAATREGCQVLMDHYPDAGPLGGIATGLSLCDGWSMVVACDMPFAGAEIFCYLAGRATEHDEHNHECWDAIVPFVDGYAQTNHALYHPRILPTILHQIDQDDLRITNLLARIRTCYVDEDELQGIDQAKRAFTNVNTPQEWHSVQRAMNKSDA